MAVCERMRLNGSYRCIAVQRPSNTKTALGLEVPTYDHLRSQRIAMFVWLSQCWLYTKPEATPPNKSPSTNVTPANSVCKAC